MKLLQTTTMVVPLLLFLVLLVQTAIASTKCQCPPATTSHSYASSTVSCAFAHSPFLIPQPGQIMGMVDIELLLSNDADIPQTTTVEATQKRISALFGTTMSSQQISSMQREDDGTSIILLVLAPGVSNVEALTTALDLVASTGGEDCRGNKKMTMETHSVVVTDAFVYVGAHGVAGLHAGLSTLAFLLNSSEESNLSSNLSSSLPSSPPPPRMLPSIIIPYDTPKYEWRGFHLDVARHFFEMNVLINLTQRLSLLRINILHLHLTDDQGWRLPSHEKYDLLNKIGSKRYEKNGVIYDGSYTLEQIQRLVTVCLELNIDIVPEIDLPGHAGAILASYPHLGCSRRSVGSRRQGSVHLVPTKWGELDYSLCLVGDNKYDQSLSFSLEMLKHAMVLFPYSSHFHVGGDEVPSQSVDRARLPHFFDALADLLGAHDRSMIVWDEVLSFYRGTGARLPANVVIQAWQSVEKVRQALEHTDVNTRIISSPQEFAYLNKRGTTERHVATFDPLPCQLSDEYHGGGGGGGDTYQGKRPIGGATCLWTEYVVDADSLLEHAFPRTEIFARGLWLGERRSTPCVHTSMKTYMSEKVSHQVTNVVVVDDSMFWSEGAPTAGDHVTVLYPTPGTLACGIRVLTGGDRKQDRCHRCSVMVNKKIVGAVSLDEGELSVTFDVPMMVYETRLLIDDSSSRDWLMVRSMVLLPCLEIGAKDEL